MFRRVHGLQLLLGHMGGPFWARKDAGAWSIPKGGIEDGETIEQAALREFREETGMEAPPPPYRALQQARQRSGKVVHVIAVEADPDLTAFRPGTFEMEWPPRSGRTRRVPELDRVAWATPAEAADRLVGGQRVFVERLVAALGDAPLVEVRAQRASRPTRRSEGLDTGGARTAQPAGSDTTKARPRQWGGPSSGAGQRAK